MSKGLEALHRIANAKNHFKYDTLELVDKDFQIVQQELLRLEAIDNAEPSEALEILYNNAKLNRDRIEKGGIVTYAEEIEHNEAIKPYYDTIKQALLKAQEQEKVLEVLFEKRIDLESFYTSFIEGNYDYNFYDIHYGTYGLECLTEEEFDLLKRYWDEQN